MSYTITPPKTVAEKKQFAESHIPRLEQMFADDRENEDLQALLTIGRAYIADLQRVIDKRKLSFEEWAHLRNVKLLAAILIEEMHNDYQQELGEWFYGVPDDGNPLWQTMNILVDALQQFTEAMMKGRRRDYEPITDEEIAAVERLLT